MSDQVKDTSLPVTIENETVGFEGFRKVVTYQFRTEGAQASLSHEVVVCREASAVVIFDPNLEKLVLIRQFRLGTHLSNGRGFAIELAAGLIDDGEDAMESARREMVEETGLQASRIEKLGSYLPSPGIATEIIHLYYAEADASNLTSSSGLASESEQTFPFLLSLDEALDAIDRGDICNGIAITGIMWFARARGKLTGNPA